MTIRTESPGAIVIQPGTIVPGRARGVAPLRREGPSKLTGAAKYADDLVFPGAWYGVTIRSTDAHARFVALDLDPAFDWSSVVVVTAADIPGDNIVSSIKSDQPILVPVGGEIQHHAGAAGAHRGPRQGHAPGGPSPHRRPGPSRCPRSSIRSSPSTSSPTYTVGCGRCRRRVRGRRPHPRRRVPGRPPGAALHREQRDDRRPARGRRRRGPRLAPVPVLRPCGAQARSRPDRRAGPGRPGRDRRRVRWQGGVPVGHRAARGAPRGQGRPAGPDDLRPPRGHRRDDEAPPGDRPPSDRGDPRREARRPGHRGRDGRRRVLHADAGRAVARRAARGRAVPLPERPDPGPGHAHEYAPERRVSRIRGAADRVRGRDPSQPDRRGTRHQPARDPAAERVRPGRLDADRPGPARERGR